jgi:pilus assembly protein CpaC
MHKKSLSVVIFVSLSMFFFNKQAALSNIDVPQGNIVQIAKGEMKMINLKGVPERLDIETRGVVDVYMQDKNTLIIKGVSKGFTSMYVLYNNGNIDQYGITVSEAASALINGMAEQMRANLAPVKTIDINVAGDKIIVSGVIEDEKYLDYYKKIVSLYGDYIVNMVKTSKGTIEVQKPIVQKPSTKEELVDIVQIDVKVVQIKADDGLDLGIRWFPGGTPWTLQAGSSSSYQYQSQKTINKNTQGQNNYSSTKTKTGEYKDSDPSAWSEKDWSRTDTISNTSSLSKIIPDTLTRTLLYNPSINISNVNFQLIALAEEGKLKMLATPKLIVQSGKTASFLVGGEIPIAQSTGFVSSVDWKKYGTTLEISPEVTSSGSIFISLHATLSELDYAHKVGDYPALVTKEAETKLTTQDGETFAIAGLISQDYTDTVDKVPLLGDIPLLGYLFKRKTKSLTNVETIMFFTPHIVKRDGTMAAYGDPAGIYPSSEMHNYITGYEREINKVPQQISEQQSKTSTTNIKTRKSH